MRQDVDGRDDPRVKPLRSNPVGAELHKPEGRGSEGGSGKRSFACSPSRACSQRFSPPVGEGPRFPGSVESADFFGQRRFFCLVRQ